VDRPVYGLQLLGASGLGIALAIVLDYFFGLWGRGDRDAVAWLWAGLCLLVGALLFALGIALDRRSE
jgi:hypothetical protein